MLNPVSVTELEKAQRGDTELQSILANDQLNIRLTAVPFQTSSSSEPIILYCDSGRPYIPNSLHQRLFHSIHDQAHPGIHKTTVDFKTVWPFMRRDCHEWARTCLPCQRSKPTRHTRSMRDDIAILMFRFDHIDIIGPLLPSEGKQYCLTAIDRFSGWPEA